MVRSKAKWIRGCRGWLTPIEDLCGLRASIILTYMEEQPKSRTWFQLHLSTCVVLMLVTGVLVWASLQPRLTEWYHGWAAWGVDTEYGWPLAALSNRKITLGDGVGGISYHPLALSVNVVSCTLILALTAVACEYAIRRRRRQRGSESASDA